MKYLCESMLYCTSQNWLDLLRISRAIDSRKIELDVLSFLIDNIKELFEADALSEEFPDLLETVLNLRKVAFPSPPSQLLIEQTKLSMIAFEQKK